MVANRQVYTHQIRVWHTLFKKTHIDCSLSSFIKYRPFYIYPPTEREKVSCLCKKCQNAHALLAGVNTFRKVKRLAPHKSVTGFLEIDLLQPGYQDQESFESTVNLYPEFFDEKEVKYYIFEQKEEKYYKNGEEKTYYRTARIDKHTSVNKIAQELAVNAESYLKHRLHVINIDETFPIIKQSFKGTYIELDFSENLAMKPKFEVQFFWKTIYPSLCYFGTRES